MKRTPKYPYRASEAEIKANCSRTYEKLAKPSRITYDWRKDNYGVVKTN